MINIVLNGAQLLVQCAALLCLVRIRRYLNGIDVGQEETNEYLSDIRKMHKEAMSVETDETCSGLEDLSDFMGGERMYLVPTELPKYCNRCPFGHCNYNHPYWSSGSDSGIDGKRNASGTYGYTCNLEIKENGRFTKVLRANIGEDIKKPDWCELKESED